MATEKETPPGARAAPPVDGSSPPDAVLGGCIKPYAPRIFVSSTTGDLGSYRQLVSDELLRGKCLPIVQKYFAADPRRLSEFLDDEIRKCDVVICLLGPRFGEAPEGGSGGVRSYTQLEYDAARRLSKDMYVFLATPPCVLDSDAPETDEKRRLQQAHIASVQRNDQSICRMFSGPEELRADIIRLVPALAKAKQEAYWVQSPPPYAYFAGREAELKQLTQAATGNGPAVVVVRGDAGQGKTTLVWEWFRNHRPDVFAAAFWCPAEENEFTLEMWLDHALTYLLQGKYDKRSFPQIQTRVRMLVQYLRDRPCLLVVDGLEKWLSAWMQKGDRASAPADSDGRLGGQDCLDLFLGQLCAVSGGSRVVLTSRVAPAALESAPHAVIPVFDEVRQARLLGLDDAAAVALLRKLGVKASDEETLAVARDYEKHPLSLTILGKLASRKYGGSLERLKGESHLIAEDARLSKLLKDIQQALPAGEDSAHLLDLLAHFIETPSYERFSGFLSWLVIHANHAALAVRPALHLDDDALREALATLDDWSLITWDRRDNSLHLHPLLREHFRRASTRSGQVDTALAEWYLSQKPAEDAHSLQDMRSRILAVEHGLRAGNAALCDAAILMPVAQCSSLSEWLALWGHQSAGIDLLTKTIGLSAQPERSKHLISRGAMYQDLGRLALARDDLTEAIAWLSANVRRRHKHRDVFAGAHMNRGNALASSGRPDQAMADFNRALRILAAPLGLCRSKRLMAADVLTNRGAANRDLGHLSAAVQDATKALDIYRRHLATSMPLLPETNLRFATVLLNRGNALANGRQYDEAAKDYREALDVLSHRKVDDASRRASLMAVVRSMMGLLLSDKGMPKEAIEQHDLAIGLLGELVRQGRLELRTTLAHGYSNRVETLILLERLKQAADDADAAKRLYDQSGWEDMSRLAIWDAANQTSMRGLSRILGKEIVMGRGDPDIWRAWTELSQRQGLHVLAPFVRANVGIARLAFRYDPRFSAEAVCGVLAVVEDGMRGGYSSEWLMWEVRDLVEFVSQNKEALDLLGVPVERVKQVCLESTRRAQWKA